MSIDWSVERVRELKIVAERSKKSSMEAGRVGDGDGWAARVWRSTCFTRYTVLECWGATEAVDGARFRFFSGCGLTVGIDGYFMSSSCGAEVAWSYRATLSTSSAAVLSRLSVSTFSGFNSLSYILLLLLFYRII